VANILKTLTLSSFGICNSIRVFYLMFHLIYGATITATYSPMMLVAEPSAHI